MWSVKDHLFNKWVLLKGTHLRILKGDSFVSSRAVYMTSLTQRRHF